MIKLLPGLVRLYPRPFRAEFGKEMIRMLVEARREASSRGGAAVLSYFSREAAGLVRGVGWEWLVVGWRKAVLFAEERGHWGTAAAIAMAIQCAVYGALVPIGPGAIASTGSGLYRLAALLVCAGVIIEAARAFTVGGRDGRRVR